MKVDVRKCDRCGEEYKHTERNLLGQNDFVVFRNMAEVIDSINIRALTLSPNKENQHLDLCPACQKKLNKFMTSDSDYAEFVFDTATLYFKDYDEAAASADALIDVIKKCGQASVLDWYDIVGVDPVHISDALHYGWPDLGPITIEENTIKHWKVCLPKPILMDLTK